MSLLYDVAKFLSEERKSESSGEKESSAIESKPKFVPKDRGVKRDLDTSMNSSQLGALIAGPEAVEKALDGREEDPTTAASSREKESQFRLGIRTSSDKPQGSLSSGSPSSGSSGAGNPSGEKTYSSNANTVLTWAREAKSGKNKVNPGITRQLNGLMTQYDSVKNDKSPAGKARKEEIVKQIGALQQQSRSPQNVSYSKPANTFSKPPGKVPSVSTGTNTGTNTGGNSEKARSTLYNSGLFAGTPKGDELRKGAEWMSISDAIGMDTSSLMKRMISDIAGNERSDMAIRSLSTLTQLLQIPEYKLQNAELGNVAFSVARRYASDPKFSNFINSTIPQIISNPELVSSWKELTDTLKVMVLTQNQGSQEYKDALSNLSKLMSMSLMKPRNENSHSSTLRDVKIETQRIKDYIQRRKGSTQTQLKPKASSMGSQTFSGILGKDTIPGQLDFSRDTIPGELNKKGNKSISPRTAPGSASGPGRAPLPTPGPSTSPGPAPGPSTSPGPATSPGPSGNPVRNPFRALSLKGSKASRTKNTSTKNSSQSGKTEENRRIQREIADLNKRITELIARKKALISKLKTEKHLKKDEKIKIYESLRILSKQIRELVSKKVKLISFYEITNDTVMKNAEMGIYEAKINSISEEMPLCYSDTKLVEHMDKKSFKIDLVRRILAEARELESLDTRHEQLEFLSTRTAAALRQVPASVRSRRGSDRLFTQYSSASITDEMLSTAPKTAHGHPVNPDSYAKFSTSTNRIRPACNPIDPSTENSLNSMSAEYDLRNAYAEVYAPQIVQPTEKSNSELDVSGHVRGIRKASEAAKISIATAFERWRRSRKTNPELEEAVKTALRMDSKATKNNRHGNITMSGNSNPFTSSRDRMYSNTEQPVHESILNSFDEYMKDGAFSGTMAGNAHENAMGTKYLPSKKKYIPNEK